MGRAAAATSRVRFLCGLFSLIVARARAREPIAHLRLLYPAAAHIALLHSALRVRRRRAAEIRYNTRKVYFLGGCCRRIVLPPHGRWLWGDMTSYVAVATRQHY